MDEWPNYSAIFMYTLNKSFVLYQSIKYFFDIFCRLQVHYPPHVTLTSDKGELLEEGDRVRFSCSASANPAQVSYAWYVGGRRVADAPDASTELVLDHVDRRLHNHLVKCEVTNPIGRSEQTAVLNIACKYKNCITIRRIIITNTLLYLCINAIFYP